jgi:type II secretory pathway component PulF
MVLMIFQDVPTTWDIDSMTHAPSKPTELYILFLLIVCVVAGLKLMDAWRKASHLRKSPQHPQPDYVQALLTHITSLQRWMWLTILTWGICMCFNVGANLRRMQFDHQLFKYPWEIAGILRDYLAFSTMALFVVTFLFLVRWYIFLRVERLPSRA